MQDVAAPVSRSCTEGVQNICNTYETYNQERPVGIVNIEDELHEQLRRASRASCRSINAQAAFWIRLGMLCELNPGLSLQELMARELKAAGVGSPQAAAAAA